MASSLNVCELWEDNLLCPISPRQSALISGLESIVKNGNQISIPANLSSAGKLTLLKQDHIILENFLCLEKKSKETFADQHHFISLENNLEICERLSDTTSQLLDHLLCLKKMYEFAVSKTSYVHSTCGELLDQEKELVIVVEAIKEQLSYFHELDNLGKKLGSPSILTLDESLIPALSRLNDCANFFQTHSNYEESAYFLGRLKELEDNILIFIKNHVVDCIQKACKQALPGPGENLSSGDNVFTLFYAKFQATSQRIKSLASIIEHKSLSSSEYMAYIKDCHEAFFRARETLIVPVLTAAIDEMVAQHGKSYCLLTKNTCQMLVHICKDEFTLYSQFFTKPSGLLIEFLDSLCAQLYNTLRPIIIHINHLETLSELCCIVKQEVIEDFTLTQGNELVPFGRTMGQLLEDVQERLVYRTNVYVQENIVHYSPAPGDLAYPEKLTMMESIAECVVSAQSPLTRSDSLSSITSTFSDISFHTRAEALNKSRMKVKSRSPADIHGMWYPTVRRTIMCLTKLYRSLDRPTFLGLAQDVVGACLKSLQNAAAEISKQKTSIDGYLFSIKHLLILREQIAPFKIECTVREVEIDFSKIQTAAFNLMNNSKDIFSLRSTNGFLHFLFEVPVSIFSTFLTSRNSILFLMICLSFLTRLLPR